MAAGLILLAYCKIRGLDMKFRPKEHLMIVLQGLLLFGLNYWLVYLSEEFLTSGLVAVAFSTLIFFNIFFGAILLGNKIKKKVILGATLGVIGTGLIFKPELSSFDFSDDNFTGLVFCIVSIVFASLGNITSAFNQRNKLPVIQTNAFGMVYGAVLMALIAFASGKIPTFDTSMEYTLSLVYLVIFGSIIAFSAYLTLIGKIGPSKAAYVILVVPIIALIISTLLEGYEWSEYAFIGTGLIIAGNVLALRN